MANWQIKLSLFLNYFVFAILLNSVGTVILQVQGNYGISESSASILEAFKDLSIAGVSFLVSSYIVRIGYKKSMLIALAVVIAACLIMALFPGFGTTQFLFAAVGSSFALIKVSVYATIGIITKDKSEHASFMNFIESFFMVGVLTGYFIFSAFVDNNNPQSTSWLQVYYLLAAISAVAFVLLLTAPLDESAAKVETSKPLVEEFGDMFKLLILPLVLVFIASAFLYVLIEQGISTWLPTFNKKVLKMVDTLSIQVTSIMAASTALGRLLAGVLLRRFHWLYVLTTGLILAAILILIAIPLAQNNNVTSITQWSDAPLAAFIIPFIGLLLAPIYPAINSLILSSLPAYRHGAMSGLIVVFSALGGTTGSLITGYTFEHYGGEKAFYFSLIPLSILIVCLFFFNRLQKKSGAAVDFSHNSGGGH